MLWLCQIHPATALGSSHVEWEFERLRMNGGGETMLTYTMILECSPELGLNLGFIYHQKNKSICGIVRRKDANDDPKRP